MTAATTGPLRPVGIARFGRRRFDRQPTQAAAVLIATTGERVSGATLRQARALAGGEPVAVVSLARIYGSAYGLPNPGLMPSKAELAAHTEVVTRTVGRLERAGVEAWGQVAATRRPAKTTAGAAAARGCRHILMVFPDAPRWRQIVEGDLVRDVRRRVDDHVTVERGTR